MDDETKTQRNSGEIVFAILFVVISILLLSQLTSETKFSSKGQLFAQPRFWPAVGVLGMLVFGLAYLSSTVKIHRDGWPREVLQWGKAIEYLIWFMVYVLVVPLIGYLLATMLFTSILAYRLGYRDKRRLLIAAMIGFVIVLVFKSGLSVKIPGGEIYEYLPDSIRSFMIVNF